MCLVNSRARVKVQTGSVQNSGSPSDDTGKDFINGFNSHMSGRGQGCYLAAYKA